MQYTSLKLIRFCVGSILYYIQVVFSESEITRCLPSPLNQGITIYQVSGMLKGAFKKLRRSRKFKNEKGDHVHDALYLIHKPMDERLIGKVKITVDFSKIAQKVALMTNYEHE
ncbi:hypothetical protein MUB18_17245 [Sphingobacterium sp. PCS056]|jgi:hypothetical protein|uniref:hypothetical protein n=1 Tax=Sphingobacterium sp. PCS056 TaxID=2931400 RepID=UPI00200E7614|nr:hypothetical protein [Sphingobacterium sp. PCS056]UPZ35851.1 hypothetical protein MUB18_17245 [Sphingobacterium sp. PCS056]